MIIIRTGHYSSDSCRRLLHALEETEREVQTSRKCEESDRCSECEYNMLCRDLAATTEFLRKRSADLYLQEQKRKSKKFT